MPLKYVIRSLKENAYYHAYNSGVEKHDIFLDKQDYETFLFYLFIYTSPLSEVRLRYPHLPSRLEVKNLAADIKLVSYCLMPNHFHLLLKQKSPDSMPKLLKQITNGYITYFHRKYQRIGRVFQGRYLAVRIESEYLLIQMVRFVHLNPLVAGLCSDLHDYFWSSYNDHSSENDILNRFGTVAEWEKFHSDKEAYKKDFPKLRNLIVDD